MEEKNVEKGEINVIEKKSTLIKWVLFIISLVFFITTIVFLSLYINEKNKDNENKNLYNNIQITEEWDKVFQKSDKVNH